MIEDAELLRRYAGDRSEPAFAELVQRHVNLVYAAALRRVGGDAQLAEEVAQTVFTTLARKAGTLAGHPVLIGWLHRSTHYAAVDALREKLGRERREQSIAPEIMNANAETNGDRGAGVDWAEVRPVIDSLLDQLNERDRGALLLRFFEGCSFGQIGAALRLTEDAARRRVERALDKLRVALERRGITSTAAALSVALANQAGVAAPAGLAAAVAGGAMAGVSATGGVAAIFMSMTKAQAGIAAALALIGGAGMALQARSNAALRQEIAVLQGQQAGVAALRAENQRLASASAEVEMLRRDDAELKQLGQAAAELRKTGEERTRVATVQAQNRRLEKERQLMDDDRRAQQEVDRMKREADALAAELKRLTERSGDGSLTEVERAQIDETARRKALAIETKRTEIQRFIENSRRALSQRLETFRQLVPGDDTATILPPNFPTVGGPDFKSSVDGQNRAVPAAEFHQTPSGGSLQLIR